MLERLARRPLVPTALCCLTGAAVGSVLNVPALAWGVGAVLVSLVVWWKRGMALFAALMLLFAMEAASLMQRPMPAPQQGALLTGEVCQTPLVDGERTVLTLSGAALNGESLSWKVRVYAYEPVPAGMGDRVRMTADTWIPAGRVNPYGFDFNAWCRRNGVACASMRSGTARVTASVSAGSILGTVRARIAAAIDGAFPSDQAPLARALILGDRSDLPEDLTDDFRNAGIAHILSVSGLHVTCLAFALDFLLRRILSRRAAFFVMAPFLSAYAALVGFSGPIVRSLFMYLAFRFAPISGRPGDGLSGLSAAMILMLALNPLTAGDAGFVLSFSAMAGLILLGPPLDRLLRTGSAPRPLQHFLKAFTASLAASVAILPAVVNLFGTAQLYGPLVNIAAVPLATTALPVAFLAVPLRMLFPAAGAALAWLPALLMRLMTNLAGFAANLPYASIPVGHIPWWLCVVWAAGIFLISDHAGMPKKLKPAFAALFPAALALSMALHLWTAPGGLALDFLSVGDADAAVVHAEGQVYLVDAGDVGSTAAEYLAQTGSRLKAVFLTHPHDDHIGGAGAAQAMFPNATIYVPECWARVPGVEEAEARTGLTGPFVPLSAGDEVKLSENVTARVLYPPMGVTPEDPNDASLVLLLSCRDASALLTGDLSDLSQLHEIPDADFLKVPHHGADVKGAEILLRAASPGAVLISVGRNSAGHPSGAFLERTQRLRERVFRTDQCGMVRASLEAGGAVAVTTFLHPVKEEQ